MIETKKCECDESHVCTKCVCQKCKTYSFDSGLCDCGLPFEGIERESSETKQVVEWKEGKKMEDHEILFRMNEGTALYETLNLKFEAKEELEAELIFRRTALLNYLKKKIEGIKEKEKYDNMICIGCKNFIRVRSSHNSEDGYTECCGKKLERVQGEAFIYSPENETLDSVLTLINELIEVPHA